MGSKNGKPVLRDEDVVSLAKTSGLSDKEIRDAFESFVKEHSKGQMKPKDFRALMSSALPKKDASKMEKHVFRIYDTNNDGHVDFVEFMVVYTIMAGGTEEEVLTKIFRYLINDHYTMKGFNFGSFRLFDVNSDGVISKKEMSRLVKDMYGLLKREDPNVSAAELIAKSAFAEMDENEDGKISLKEFSTACLAEKDFSRLLTSTALDIFMEEEKTEKTEAAGAQ